MRGKSRSHTSLVDRIIEDLSPVLDAMCDPVQLTRVPKSP